MERSKYLRGQEFIFMSDLYMSALSLLACASGCTCVSENRDVCSAVQFGLYAVILQEKSETKIYFS